MAAFILNRLKLWAIKRHSRRTSTNFVRAFTFRLALIPVWNEQNQPSFLKHLPIMQFASKDTSESKSSSEPKPKPIQSLKQPNENVPEKNLPKEPIKPIKDSPKKPPKTPTVDDLTIKEISGDLPNVARNNKAFSGSSGDPPTASDEQIKEPYIPLMPFPEIIWPGLWNFCKNLYQIHFVIHVKIDPKFHPRDFLEGAREAIAQISKVLAKGKPEQLKGFVTDEAIDLITPNLSKMNLAQRHHLEMEIQDIYVGFIDLIEVVIDTKTTPNKTYVEITCCFHSLRDLMGFKQMYPDTTFYDVMDHKDRISVGNYRFTRDYTEGSEHGGHWMVNKLNHFKPLDLPQYAE